MASRSERMLKARAELQKMVEEKNMGYQPTQSNVPPMPTRVSKLKKIEGNVNNTDVVIVYGDIKGNINNCDNVIVINGDVKGNLNNCDNVAGLLADNEPVNCHTGSYIQY